MLFFVTMADQPSARHPRRGHHRSDAPGRARRTSGPAPPGSRPIHVGRLRVVPSRVISRGVRQRGAAATSLGSARERQIGWQRRRDDVAGLEVAVDGDVVRPVIPIQRDVRAHHGVDRILVPVELSRPCCGLDPFPQLHPGHIAIRPQPRAGPSSPSMCVINRSNSRWRSSKAAASCISGSSRARTARSSPGAGRPRWPAGSPSMRDPCRGRGGRQAGAARGSLNSGLPVYAGCAPASNLWKSRLSAVSQGRWPVGLFTISGASMATRQSSLT